MYENSCSRPKLVQLRLNQKLQVRTTLCLSVVEVFHCITCGKLKINSHIFDMALVQLMFYSGKSFNITMYGIHWKKTWVYLTQ